MHLLPLLAPTLTAFIGSGVGSAVVTHWLTIKRAREKLLRAKLEELFLAVSGYGIQAFSMTAPYLQAMRGKITYDQASDMAIKDFDRSSRHFEKAQMLVNLYFPEHRELLDLLQHAMIKAQRFKDAFKENYSLEQESPEVAKDYSEALLRFDKIEKLLRAKISGTSAKLLRPPSLFERVKQCFGPKAKAD
jgi:hypothetical protein